MTDIIKNRQHRILASRSTQITNNILAWKGGKPYIEARLQRAPNESDFSWGGNDYGVVGRRDRAYPTAGVSCR